MTTRRDIMIGAVATAVMPALARADEGGQYVPVPIAVTRDGSVIVRVWIDGNGPFLFMVDTGADSSGIKSDLAQKLKLKFTRGQAVDGVGGEEIEGIYLAAEARFGPYLRQRGVAFSGMPNFNYCDGLVAAGFLTQLPSVLDYGAKEIRIYTHGSPDLSDFTPVRSYLNAPDPRASAHIYVYATIDGISLKLMVDTGSSSHLLLYPSVVRDHGLWDKYGEGRAGGSHGVTGATNRTRLVDIPNFALSDVTVPHLPVTLMDPASHNENDGIDGLLGSSFLQMFAMAVTQRGMALRPIAPAASSTASSSSGA